MKDFFKNWSFKKHFCSCLGVFISFLLLLKLLKFIFVASLLSSFEDSSASIGIIGGADGPTAIYLASRVPSLGITIFCILFIITLLLYFPLKKYLSK
ncbi:sodium ion-translocating decarboxylase subunit beta [Wukongibacter baidiensis]|uniref:sodium ion-translocating decarboxylase subunit beta n=1 Tax=Wukongibacter baidiensis TaxID=1723361 RepID=UPI003D7F4364